MAATSSWVRSRLKRSSIANFDRGEATLAECLSGVVIFEMIVFWRDHSRSLLTGLRRADAPNLAEAVTMDLEEFKDTSAEFTLRVQIVSPSPDQFLNSESANPMVLRRSPWHREVTDFLGTRWRQPRPSGFRN